MFPAPLLKLTQSLSPQHVEQTGRLHESCKILWPMLDGHSDFRWFSFVFNTHPAIAIGCSSFQSNLERAVNTSILKTLRDINPLLTWEAARHLPQYVESPQP